MRRLVIVLALLAASVCFAAPAIAADGDTATTQSVDQATSDDEAADQEAAADQAADDAAAQKAADEAATPKAAGNAEPETSQSETKTEGHEPSDECSGDGPAAASTTHTECPSSYPYEAKICWQMNASDGVEGTYEFPQRRVSGDWCDKAPKCGETAEYQHDTYWIRDKDDEDYLAGLWKLNSPAGDAQLEPHDFYSVVKKGPTCHEPKEVKACWKMSWSDGVENTYEFPQTRVWGEDCDATPKCGETVEYQHDSYWIKGKDDWEYFTHLVTLNSPADDARLHPHDYYSVVKTGEACPIEVTPAVQVKSNCDGGDVPTVVPVTGVVYTFTQGDGQTGPWEITATLADDGYVFADGAQTVFTGDAGDPDACVSGTEETTDPPKTDPAEDDLLPNTGGMSLWILLLAGAMTAAGLLVTLRREPAMLDEASRARTPSHALIMPAASASAGLRRAHAAAEHIGFVKAFAAAVGSFFRGGRR